MLSPRARKSDNYRKGNKEKKQGNYTKNKAKPNKSDNFIRSKREKNWIAPLSFCILEETNNIFADYRGRKSKEN